MIDLPDAPTAGQMWLVGGFIALYGIVSLALNGETFLRPKMALGFATAGLTILFAGGIVKLEEVATA